MEKLGKTSAGKRGKITGRKKRKPRSCPHKGDPSSSSLGIMVGRIITTQRSRFPSRMGGEIGAIKG